LKDKVLTQVLKSNRIQHHLQQRSPRRTRTRRRINQRRTRTRRKIRIRKNRQKIKNIKIYPVRNESSH
ncbi:hypothetical protein TVAGG3_0046250, partial [Trichomonas vaginalis G3]